MKAYYYLLEQLQAELISNPLVKNVTTGNLDDIDNYKQTIFPLSHIIVNSANAENNILRFNVSVISMDIVDISKTEVTDKFIGNDNEQDVLNTQMIILLRLYESLNRGALNERMEVDGFPSLEPFTERFENYLAGWTMTMDIIMPNEMSIC